MLLTSEFLNRWEVWGSLCGGGRLGSLVVAQRGQQHLDAVASVLHLLGTALLPHAIQKTHQDSPHARQGQTLQEWASVDFPL